MSAATHLAASQTDRLPNDIELLGQLIAGLPLEQREPFGPVFDRVAESTRRRRRILNLVQDALGQLRLDMKYLMFDLEATRRERDALRGQLDDPSAE